MVVTAFVHLKHLVRVAAALGTACAQAHCVYNSLF